MFFVCVMWIHVHTDKHLETIIQYVSACLDVLFLCWFIPHTQNTSHCLLMCVCIFKVCWMMVSRCLSLMFVCLDVKTHRTHTECPLVSKCVSVSSKFVSRPSFNKLWRYRHTSRDNWAFFVCVIWIHVQTDKRQRQASRDHHSTNKLSAFNKFCVCV